jgi:hydroxypyruvate isomerase
MLESANYDGWIGSEYVPTSTTVESLTWLSAYRAPTIEKR